MTSSSTLLALNAAGSRADLLRVLKDVKNSVIGNTWKKVELAEDEGVIQRLLSLLGQELSNDEAVDIVNETAVIIGALANVGSLTLQPLLLSGAATQLLDLISSVSSCDSFTTRTKLLPSLLRALRNLLVSTADLMWGHMWGVGVERKVVGTGLVGEVEGKGKAVARDWRSEATRALSMVFEPNNLSTLLYLLLQSNTQIHLPLYQLFARLVVLPSHRAALAAWAPSASSALRLDIPDDYDKPYILGYLMGTILPGGTRRNPKLLEAALDLLAALAKGQPEVAAMVRCWAKGDEQPPLVGELVDMLGSGPHSVRIAAASCLTNIIKSDAGSRTFERVRSTVLNLQLLDVIVKLLNGDSLADRIKLCFVLATLVSDDVHLQKSAAEQGCPGQLTKMYTDVMRDEGKGEISADIASRSYEAILIALAALSFQHEPTRSFLSETTPPFLPQLKAALSHPSYGVRAAACQLARAFSRTAAILRTSLVDSGVGEEVIETLKREMGREGGVGEQAWTVEVAATATICNLIADFSPLKEVLLRNGGLELLCDLTGSEYGPLALNALWAIKNHLFHASEQMKGQVMVVLRYERLRVLLSPATPSSLRTQALEILQNLLADAQASELSRVVDALGEKDMFELLQAAVREREELRVPALYVLSNLALGNEKLRQALVSRVEIVESISDALSGPDAVRVPALRTLRHLLESNARSRRPRQAMVDLFHPYQLKPRLRELADGSPSLDVAQASVGLLELLERAREGASVGSVGAR